MVDRCCELGREADLFTVPGPQVAETGLSMLIKVINAAHGHPVVDVYKPAAAEPSDASTSDDHPQVRDKHRLGGEMRRSTRFVNSQGIGGHDGHVRLGVENEGGHGAVLLNAGRQPLLQPDTVEHAADIAKHGHIVL